MTVQRLKLAGVAIACFAFLAATAGAALAQSKCTSGEVKATGKKAACKLGVFSKAAAKNLPPDSTKPLGCGSKMSAAFTKAASKGDCGAAASEGTIETKVDNFENDVLSEENPPLGSTTTTTSASTTTTTGGGLCCGINPTKM